MHFKNASQIEKWTDQLTRRFLPFVLVAGAITFTAWTAIESWQVGLFNAMAVLLVACPCALGLATPIAVWRGLVRLAGKGVISRDVKLLDALGTAREIFWDKTGTLTLPELEIIETRYAGDDLFSDEALKVIVSTVETAFDHPIATTLSKLEEPDSREMGSSMGTECGVKASVKSINTQAHEVVIGDMRSVLAGGGRRRDASCRLVAESALSWPWTESCAPFLFA